MTRRSRRRHAPCGGHEGRTPPSIASPRLAYAIGTGLLLLSIVAPRTIASQASSTDLPDGPGKAVLLSACTTCHELTEVTKFKGFYTKDEWRDIVVTMVKYGAVVKNEDVPVLVDYLFKNFGKKE